MAPDAASGQTTWSAIILAGGRGARLGGSGKAEITVDGTTLLDTLLRDLPDVPVIVSGPRVPTARPVAFCREDPPFGGPVAGLAAALPLVATPVVVVLAVDMPRAGRLAAVLADACTDDGVLAVDAEGRRQPLCAAYRVDAMRQAIGEAPAANRAMRDVVARLSVCELRLEAAELVTDIDTVDDLQRQRASRGGGATMLDSWVTAVKADLGLAEDVDIDALLDVARVAAHRVERPAAPLTMYLMGLAVGAGQDPAEVAARMQRLAQEWAG